MNQKNVQSQKQNSVGMELFGEPVQVFFSKKGSARLPRIARGEGIYLWDKDGNKYLDVSSGPVANNLGSGNKKVLAAMNAQAKSAAFAFPGQFESEANERLSNLLTRLAGEGFERAFFCFWWKRGCRKCRKACSPVCVV
jgi:adenosylmethionine-8-amino-7-oxononanoate aminotransferase